MRICICLLAGIALSLCPFTSAGTQSAEAGDNVDASRVRFVSEEHELGFGVGGLSIAGTGHVLTVEFIGANPVVPEEVAAGQVTYHLLWDGVSLTYQTEGEDVAKSTYLVEPGADERQIRLGYNAPLEVSEDGSLVVGFETGEFRESPPEAWQDIWGERIPVEARFQQLDESEVGFEVGRFDRRYPLVIDPGITWHTFLGSSHWDEGYSLVLDGDGNAYITGWSYDTWGAPVNAHEGSSDAYVAKLNSDGELQWNTFLGSSSSDFGRAVAVDEDGNVYVVGESYVTWGTPVNPHTGESGDYDAFAAKLSANGSLLWNTFLGSPAREQGWAVAVDDSKYVYLAGKSGDTWGTPVDIHAGMDDAFVAKLNASGVLQWNTFMGSADIDFGRAIALDGDSNVYVTGWSYEWGSPVNPHAGEGGDAFAAKLDSSGVRQWNTFLGSSTWDDGYSIALDSSRNVYLSGWSFNSWGAPVNPHAGAADAFAAKLNSAGALQWNTFLGSSDTDYAYAIVVDEGNSSYVAGFSASTWGNPLNPHTSWEDALVAKLDPSGVLLWNTFLGSAEHEEGWAVARHSGGDVYVAGGSYGAWGTPLSPYAGPKEAFVAKLGWLAISKNAEDLNGGLVSVGDDVQYAITVTNQATATTGVVVTDTLPAGVQFGSATPLGYTGPNPLVWDIGTLDAGEVWTSVITAEVDGLYDPLAGNIASVSSDQVSCQQSDLVGDWDVANSLVIAKAAEDLNGVPLHVGDEIEYTIVVTNDAAVTTGVVVTDSLPSGVGFISADPVLGGTDPLTWDAGDMNPGEIWTGTVTVEVEGMFDPLDGNVASVSSDQVSERQSNSAGMWSVQPRTVYLPLVVRGVLSQ